MTDVIEIRGAPILGRARELAVLLELLERDGPAAVFVHGPGGIGKSTLVEAFAAEASARHATGVRFDGRGVEPTERGMFAWVAGVTGMPVAGSDDLARALASLPAPAVLVLDTYEVLRVLDPWVRNEVVPRLGGVRLLVAGREPPVSAWLTTGDPGRFRSVLLGPLARADAMSMLQRSGFSERDAVAVQRIARGHPLALRVAGMALQERPDRLATDHALPRVVEELIALYLDGVSPGVRRLLDAASCLRRVTVPLLDAMLPEEDAVRSLEQLRALPFVDDTPDGLHLHEAVRAAVAARLEATDPESQRRYRAAAWRRLRSGVRGATRAELWRYTADLLFLLQNEVVREAFFPTTQHLYSVEPAEAADAAAIFAIVERHEPSEAAAVLRAWWDILPSAFRVVRDRSDAVAGFSIVVRGDRVPMKLVRADPIVAAWREHLRASPPSGPTQVLFDRRELAIEHGEAPSPVQAAIWLDIKRMYMELRPNLARLYTVAVDPSPYLEAMKTLGFAPFPAPVQIGRPHHLAVLDMGPGSVDGWLARLAAAELGIEEEGILDVGNREAVLDGRRIPLTKLESGVLATLIQHEGKAVGRLTLLEQVWGSSYEGGSNVVDVVVRGLRKKLGAEVIHTVRGLGYRYVPR